SERDVVKEEYRQRILANPYGEFSLAIDQKSFAAHPYKRPSIGNIAELDAAQLPEVKAFHSTFYRPDNATLIVVGDFKASDLETWTKKYLGPITRPRVKIPRVTVDEPSRKEDRHEVLFSAKAPLPAFAVTYLAPSVRNEDEAELDKAKNRFLTGKLMERETSNGKASALGEAAVIYGDPNHINTDLAKYQAVTASQIKDVLNKYIAGKKKVLIEYLPEAKKEAAKPEETEKL